ncbi:winged helix-turn-helix domain-containing protein [Rhabdaerophilum sp. SD176]|uniref:ArsR/SmtB family transcription factor n=1 Tax=Rhabdaerophilum sp. SD176 TaxID=2983548 RepID=UPI0024DFD767|nr:winged helix-turn-helix domain-containing protein [Rhabdaerophilum sp. SD176]
MKNGPDIAALASLIGDPARANILAALMGGRALTAGECAAEAGISPSAASGHLARLLEAGLLVVLVQGRHRYFNIAGPDVAEAVETLMGLAARVGLKRTRPGPREAAMRRARFCYDHLAGNAATALFARLVDRGMLVAQADGLGLSAKGRLRFLAEGIDIAALEEKPRPLCRACLDWSERRPHLAGSLGAAIARLAIERGWCRREAASRAVHFSPDGERALLALGATGQEEALDAEERGADRTHHPARRA